MVQRLRPWLPAHGEWVQSLLWELRSYMPQVAEKPKHKKQRQYCNKLNKDFKKWFISEKKKRKKAPPLK